MGIVRQWRFEDVSEFTTTTVDNDMYTIECTKGLWSVSSPDFKEAFSSAMWYFQQYWYDGEYTDQLLDVLRERGSI